MSSTSTIADGSMAVKNGKPIVFSSYRGQEFETQGLKDLDYTQYLLSRSAPHSVHLSQGDVSWFFEGDVREKYGQEDPKCRFLLQQRPSPLAIDFGEKYTDPGKILCRKSQKAKSSFCALPHDKHSQPKGSVMLK